MRLQHRLTQIAFGVAAAFAIGTVGAQSLPPPLTPNPDGTWTGTVKCEGYFQSPYSKFATAPLAIVLVIEGGEGFVLGRFGETEGAPTYVEYFGAWYPTAKTLGFGTSPEINSLPYLETGQGKIEAKKDGSVALNGKSIVLADSPSPGGAVSATCDWKLKKMSDDPLGGG